MSIASRIASLTRKAAAAPCLACAAMPRTVFAYLDDPAAEAAPPDACAVCGYRPALVVFTYDDAPARDGLETLAE